MLVDWRLAEERREVHALHEKKALEETRIDMLERGEEIKEKEILCVQDDLMIYQKDVHQQSYNQKVLHETIERENEEQEKQL